jgi:K(+)-stimulated pyrophosphate-energized sodium pump
MLLASTAGASEAELVVPDLAQGSFLGMTGSVILTWGLVICILGIVFSLVQFTQIKNLPVHKSMLNISELIYETCKTYLIQQGKFLSILWAFIAVIIVWYFSRTMESYKVAIIVVFSIVGILGSYSVAWFGIRMNTYANSRPASRGSRESRTRRWRSR